MSNFIFLKKTVLIFEHLFLDFDDNIWHPGLKVQQLEIFIGSWKSLRKFFIVFFAAYFSFNSITSNKVMAVFYVRFSICKNSSVVSLWVRRVIYHAYLFLSPQLLSLYILFYCEKKICFFSPFEWMFNKQESRLFVLSLRWFLRHCRTRMFQLRSLRRYTWH